MSRVRLTWRQRKTRILTEYQPRVQRSGEMPSKSTNHSRHATKKSAKMVHTPVTSRRQPILRRIHTTPAGTAADIRASLGITKADLEAALTAIESAL